MNIAIFSFKKTQLVALSLASWVGLTPLHAAPTEQIAQGLPRHAVLQDKAQTPASQQAPQNIILMVGDGMGMEHIACALTANCGKLHMLQLPVMGMIQTNSDSDLITDSAAAATAFACGQKTYNGALGVNPQGADISNTAELAQKEGYLTGIIATKCITDATPAAFYAHVLKRNETAAIAEQLCKSQLSVVMGGGKANFTPAQQQSLQEKQLNQSLLLRWFADADCPLYPNAGMQLDQCTADALTHLESQIKQQGKKGFFLMVEGSNIDVASHKNDLKACLGEILEFDKAVGIAKTWVQQHPNTLLIVVADHATGGLILHGGDLESGQVEASYSSNHHNGILIPLMAAGAGSTYFQGFIQNTDIHHIMKKLLRGERAK